jgi:hypothetical protein
VRALNSIVEAGTRKSFENLADRGLNAPTHCVYLCTH